MLPAMTSDVEGSGYSSTAPRRSLAAACIGNAVEWYDFALFGALVSVIGVVFFPGHGLDVAITAAFATYGTAFLVRPIGAVVFGRLGDRKGRRTVLVRVVLVMTVATSGMAFLPGYHAIGVLAPLLLVLLRAAQGLAAGGELGVATVFILETAAPAHRGRAGGWQVATMAFGMAVGMAVAAVVTSLPGDVAAASPWWRLAFLVSLPMGLIGLYLRRRVAETEQFARIRAAAGLVEHPLRDLWENQRSALVRGFCLLAAGSLAFNTFFVFLPNSVIARHGADTGVVLTVTAGTLLVAGLAAVAWGRLSDRVGRRPLALGAAIALAALAPSLGTLAPSSGIGGLLVAQLVIGLTVGGVLSMAMIGDLFEPRVRSTGVALTAGVATAAVGGTGPWVNQLLVTTLHLDAAPGWYTALVAVVAVVALSTWPLGVGSRPRRPADAVTRQEAAIGPVEQSAD